MLSMLEKVLQHNGLVAAFALVGIVMGLSMWVSKKLTFGRVHGSAIAIMIGLVLAYWGGMQTGGERGVTLQPAGQHAHHRPAGECQNGSPEQRGSKRRQDPETGGQQPEEQNLHQQAIIVEHARLLY